MGNRPVKGLKELQVQTKKHIPAHPAGSSLQQGSNGPQHPGAGHVPYGGQHN